MSETNPSKNGRSALEVADDLAESLDENTAALNRLQRRNRVLLVLVGVIFVTLFSVVKFNHDGNVNRCESGNELRVEIDGKFQSLSDSPALSAASDSAEGREFLELLAADLEPRDCSNVSWLG